MRFPAAVERLLWEYDLEALEPNARDAFAAVSRALSGDFRSRVDRLLADCRTTLPD